jgi:hypothetical protein
MFSGISAYAESRHRCTAVDEQTQPIRNTNETVEAQQRVEADLEGNVVARRDSTTASDMLHTGVRGEWGQPALEGEPKDERVMKRVTSQVVNAGGDGGLYSRESGDAPWRRAFPDGVSPAFSPSSPIRCTVRSATD